MQQGDAVARTPKAQHVAGTGIKAPLTIKMYPGIVRCASSPTSILLLSLTVIGRFDKACGHSGTIAIPATLGCRIGPLADSAYAVDPVGVETIMPSARRIWISSPSTLTSSSIMRPGFPLVDHDVVERQGRKFNLAITQHFGVKQEALFAHKSPFQQLGDAAYHGIQRNVGHEAKAALIDPNQGYIETGEIPCRIEHGAVTTKHDRQFGTLADQLITGNRIAIAADGSSGRFLDQNLDATPMKEDGQRQQGFGDLGTAVFAYQGDAAKCAVHGLIKPYRRQANEAGVADFLPTGPLENSPLPAI
jgi:hypothetical protein